MILALQLLSELFDFAFEVTLLVKGLLVSLIKCLILRLQLPVLSIISLSQVFELLVETSLHLCLLEEHLLTHLVECLLVFDLHGIAYSADFFLGLREITDQLLPLLLM